MNDEQGILRRLDHYADCIEKGVHVTGTQLKSLVKDIRESGLVLSQSPPAEAQPVAWQFQDREGNWHEFIDEQHRLNTIEDGSWPIRALYAHPPPSAPAGVELSALRVQEWLQREYDILPPVQEIEQAMRTPCSCPDTERALAQQPEAPTLAKYQPCGCVICTFEAEHGGNRADHPPYVVQQPAAVDGADAQDAEIEALRAEAIEWRGLFGMAKARADKAEARAERAEAEAEALKSDLGDYMDAANYQAARAERLAEALRWYVENDDTNEGQEGNEYWLAVERLRTRAAEAESRAERLAEALRWYAEQAELCRKLGAAGDSGRRALDADGGKRARAALQGHDQGGGDGNS